MACPSEPAVSEGEEHRRGQAAVRVARVTPAAAAWKGRGQQVKERTRPRAVCWPQAAPRRLEAKGMLPAVKRDTRG